MMLMRALMLTTSAVALAIAVPASAATMTDVNGDPVYGPSVAAVRGMEARSVNTFGAELARQYQELALFEADEMYDATSSEAFAEKALAASRGEAVEPSSPERWKVQQQFMAELKQGRTRLMQALDGGAREQHPREAAVAQAKYDCWVEQTWEGLDNPWQDEHIAACRTQFQQAMNTLDPAQAAPQQPAYRQMDIGTTVYFAFDSAEISSEARQKLDSFVNLTREGRGIVVTVVGHTDTAGPADYNKRLSERRAEAVRAELLDRGLDVRDLSELQIRAEGESEPAVKTGDGVREQRNRRVVVDAYQRIAPEGGQVSTR